MEFPATDEPFFFLTICLSSIIYNLKLLIFNAIFILYLGINYSPFFDDSSLGGEDILVVDDYGREEQSFLMYLQIYEN